jgi:hypothetical protein
MCGPAATGQLDGLEVQAMEEHLERCTECRCRIEEIVQISSGRLLLHGEAFSKPRIPAGMTARFLDRAHVEGVPVRVPSGWVQDVYIWKLVPAVFALALVLFGVDSASHQYHQAKVDPAEALQQPHDGVLINRSAIVASKQPNSTKPRIVPVRVNQNVRHATLSLDQQQDGEKMLADSLFFPRPEHRRFLFLAAYAPSASESHASPKLLLASASFGTDGNESVLSGVRGAFSFQDRAPAFPISTQPHIDWRQLRIHLPQPSTEQLPSQRYLFDERPETR